MHMRTKKWARPLLAASSCFVDDPAAAAGRWNELFPAEKPLHLELGCGKGVSTALMAHDNPDINYIAMDISPDVLGCARRNLTAAYGDAPVDNILLTRCDIEHISLFVKPEDRVSRIYINFCNPWTKRPKHHKRRLTHPRQLMQYRQLLSQDGEIWFKTDDDALFRDSLNYFQVCGFDTVYLTYDLHADGFTPNYVSEHERKYTAAGVPVKFGIFRKSRNEVSLDPVTWREWSVDTAADDENDPEDEEA